MPLSFLQEVDTFENAEGFLVRYGTEILVELSDGPEIAGGFQADHLIHLRHGSPIA